MLRTQLLILLATALLGGCASNAVNDNFGKSVAQMRRAQTYNSATLDSRGDAPVLGVDPDSAKAAVDSMRKDTADRTTVKRNVAVNVSSQQGGGSQ